MQEKEMLEKIPMYINELAAFCGKRDVAALTQDELMGKYGIRQADVMVLFGGSIICGGDLLAQAIKDKVAKTYFIVGGAGHTTQTLRDRMSQYLPEHDMTGKTEAQMFAWYLEKYHGVRADHLETHSTNCGNNVTYLLQMLKEKSIDCRTMIIMQDAAMQLRMEAGLAKHAPQIRVINYAAYQAVVCRKANRLAFEQPIKGMWSVEHYMTLLLGEIARLTDDENGYGPNGKDYIAHVDIPASVKEAFAELQKEYAGMVRGADPAYRSK